ncbi:MAG: FHA domain-containing protein [Anaerolineales bacterium]
MENIGATFLLALRLLMALALYAFLGWCFYIMWRDLRQQAESLTKQRVPHVHIALLGENGTGEQLRFTAPEITIGRNPTCEWMLPDETVSSEHARLVYRHDQWWLEDLNSKNGTFLNGEALTAPVVLADQDEIRCGQVSFSITFEELKEAEAIR